MDWKTFKYLIHLSLCFCLINTQNLTTTDPPPASDGPDAATIARLNLEVGAANVDYGPFAYHRKYIPALSASSNHHFSYNPNDPRGPSRWAEQWPLCGGPLQSPIDIPLSQCPSAGSTEYRLQYYNSQERPSKVTIENNGYSIEMLFHFNRTPVLYGGPLTEAYIFEFIHFHWGIQDRDGSENHMDGITYDMEMHLGHRNSKYRNLGEAGMHQDGIVVLSFLFSASEAALDWPPAGEFDVVGPYNTSLVVQDTDRYRLSNFVGGLMEQVVNFRGSLMTPPCSPANWFVVPQVREISRKDVLKFRSALGNGFPVAPNYRPVQDRQNRECRSFGGDLY